ncbi:MAG: alpha/beta fold hydrolase [bacterium]|nr:alpha/beta fold hydrolase [bacterium]
MSPTSAPADSASAAKRFAAQFNAPEHRSFALEGTNGAAAVMVHGFPGTPAEMRPLADVFHADGWTVSAPLLPGFGHDLETLAHRTWQEWAAAVDSAVEALRPDHRVVMGVGLSMGGALMLHTAARGKIDAVAGVNPFWKLDNALWNLLPAIKIALPNFKPFSLMPINFDDPETRRGMAAFMPDADLDDPAVQQAVKQFSIPTHMLDQIRAIGALAGRQGHTIRVPALIVQGAQDQLVRPALTRELAGRIASAQYREITGEHNLLARTSPGAEQAYSILLAFANQQIRR